MFFINQWLNLWMCLTIILFIDYERTLSLNILIYSFTYKFMLLILSNNIINSLKRRINLILLYYLYP